MTNSDRTRAIRKTPSKPPHFHVTIQHKRDTHTTRIRELRGARQP